MCKNIAQALGIEAGRVNVKATTEEGLGFTGSGEGISAQAICALRHAVGDGWDGRMEEDGAFASGCPGCKAGGQRL